jgi:hypothetical protein
MQANLITPTKGLIYEIECKTLPIFEYEKIKNGSCVGVQGEYVIFVFESIKKLTNTEKLGLEFVIEFDEKTKMLFKDCKISKVSKDKNQYEVTIGVIYEDDNLIKKYLNKIR